ncbi:MAG: recombination protein RecR [Deltaproteobacteria bacterium]|nr:recombination protein RecR [Deltaproteobacteria bacterium]
MADAIQDLSELLARLPGVGRRTALRLTFHILRADEEYVHRLGESVGTIRDRVRPCSECRNLAEADPCPICSDPRRDRNLICVVAGVPDLWAVEESGSYRGLYHVLHGLLAPLDGIGPDDLNVDLLLKRVEQGEISEVVIATRPSVEGEATSLLISQALEGQPAKLTRIASGIPHGGELEYADRMTLGRAFRDRRDL